MRGHVCCLVVGLAAAGCSENGDTGQPLGPLDLVEASRWAPADPGADLFADQRPAQVECDDEEGYYVEPDANGLVFEVSTTWCNYFTGSQTAMGSVSAGQEVEVRVWHYQTTTPDDQPATAYLGVGMAGAIVWETTVDLPGEAGWIEETFTLDEDCPEGSDVQFHIHNHGMNAWQIASIRRL